MLIGIPYVLTAPDGSRVVVGNSDAAKADPDWVGYLNPSGGVSIQRNVRLAADELADADGAALGDSWLGAATIVLNGVLDPNVSAAAKHLLEQKLRKATSAQHADGTLTYQPTGDEERKWWWRRAADPDIGTGQGPWAFALQLISGRSNAIASVEQSGVIVAGNPGAAAGVLSPLVDPGAAPLASTGQLIVTPGGSVPWWPRFRIYGPITNPLLVNNTTGEWLRIVFTLAAGEYLDIYPETGTVLFGTSVLGDPTNTVINPVFAVDLSAWTVSASVVTRMVDWLATSARFQGDALNDAFYQALANGAAVAPGETWTGQAHLRVDAITGGATVVPVIYWWNAGGGFLSTSQGAAVATLGDKPVVSVSAVAPATAAKGTFGIEQRTAGTIDLRIREAMMVKQAAASTYFDGSMPGYAFTGAAHASTSRTWLPSGAALQDRSGSIDRTVSRWWRLLAGVPNDVRLLATAFSTGGGVNLYRRNAWEV